MVFNLYIEKTNHFQYIDWENLHITKSGWTCQSIDWKYKCFKYVDQLG